MKVLTETPIHSKQMQWKWLWSYKINVNSQPSAVLQLETRFRRPYHENQHIKSRLNVNIHLKDRVLVPNESASPWGSRALVTDLAIQFTLIKLFLLKIWKGGWALTCQIREDTNRPAFSGWISLNVRCQWQSQVILTHCFLHGHSFLLFICYRKASCIFSCVLNV